MKYAPEHVKMDVLPRICRGEVCFAIGMSEPNSGSTCSPRRPRRPNEGRLADQRHQDLDQQRAHRRLHDRPVPHLSPTKENRATG
jgi:alkylation response protein AidB-like acyl-CoA dehydrogenase